jgi:predicted O-linked N-acetylglucosamine transferase (SPINDLY family)
MELGRNDLIAAIQQGMAAQRSGRLADAETQYKRVLAVDPNQFEALHFLGLLEAQRGNLPEADRLVGHSLTVNTQRPEAFANHARILRQLGRPQEALTRCDRALALNPQLVDAHVLRSNTLRDLGRFPDALASIDLALIVRPQDPLAHYNRGLVLLALMRAEEALVNLDKALALQPNHPDFLIARGQALDALQRQDDAVRSYEQALAARPGDVEALIGRGGTLHLMGRTKAALDSYAQALAAQPGNAKARLAHCIAQLPVLYETDAEVAAQRAAYDRDLQALCDDAEHGGLNGLGEVVGMYLPFFLAYQGENDRDLQARYGALVCRAMAARFPPAPLAAPPAPGERIRVGIVSGYFWRHSVWKIPVKGWVTQLDPGRFELFGYYCGAIADAETDVAAKLCKRFVRGPMPLERWREAIVADAPHVLLYPDINMDPASAALAALRLAPVQAMSLGHPDTSGYPTMDYFLSSDLMEPSDGDAHYTETLVRLPNLSVYYDPLDTPPVAVSRADLGLRQGAIVFWCGQSLFKYLPRHDEVFPRIAKAAGDCQFAFIGHPKGEAATEVFRRRLERAFAAHGLDAAKHCVMLPRRPQHEFVAAIGVCDIVLDSIGWSGFNSTIEGLVHDLPIVTMSGPLMRGRHTTAVLRMMGVTETVTDTVDAFVAVAQRLATDPAWYAGVKDRMRANKRRVYRDSACITALEEFLIRATRERRGG